jgi:hypothetical protein
MGVIVGHGYGSGTGMDTFTLPRYVPPFCKVLPAIYYDNHCFQKACLWIRKHCLEELYSIPTSMPLYGCIRVMVGLHLKSKLTMRTMKMAMHVQEV